MAAELSQRLAARRPEIEEAILTRARSVADPTVVGDPEYLHGLTATVQTALGHAIAVLEGGSMASRPIPPELTAQARRAARNGVGLDTVLRRYIAGHTLLCDCLLAEAVELPSAVLRRALRTEGVLLDRIVTDVTDAYTQEIDRRRHSAEHSRTERVKRLLAGEPVDAAELGYDLDLWHVGALVTAADAPAALRDLAAALDRRLLLVRPGGEQVWAWFGGHHRLTAESLAERARVELGTDLTLAVGEPGRGAAGWRLTHRQAKVAWPIARRGVEGPVRYAEVALLSSIAQDDLLISSLQQIYLAPLERERDGGEVARQTLRAYLSAGRSATSAAAALQVSRNTVANRLRGIEQRIGRPLDHCLTELEVALRIEELSEPLVRSDD